MPESRCPRGIRTAPHVKPDGTCVCPPDAEVARDRSSFIRYLTQDGYEAHETLPHLIPTEEARGG